MQSENISLTLPLLTPFLQGGADAEEAPASAGQGSSAQNGVARFVGPAELLSTGEAPTLQVI